MQCLLVVASNQKDQYRIKALLEEEFQVKASDSIHNSLELAREKHFDMILYDTDQITPLKSFLEELRTRQITTPVSALCRQVDIKSVWEMKKLKVISVIKKPFSRLELLLGIQKGFKKYEERPKEIQYTLKKEKAEVVMGMNKKAVISELREHGMTLILPNLVTVGTKMVFSNTELSALLGLTYERSPRIEVVVKKCVPMNDFRYKAEMEFGENISKNFYISLLRYLEKHAVAAQQAKADSLLKTILVADVDGFIRDYYKVTLEDAGFRVLFASDGFEVFEVLEKENVGLLILDLLLPKLTGQEVLELMQQRSIRLPIIAATAENDPAVVRKVAPQVQEYLLKPFAGQVLLERISKILHDWKGNKATQKKGGLSMPIHLETNLMMTFREQVRLVNVLPKGVIFIRNSPLATNTRFTLKTDAIAAGAPDDAAASFFDLKVVRCRFSEAGKGFELHAAFASIEN